MTMTFLEAVARMEGFYRKGARPQRNSNPGDIEFGKFAAAHGATHAEQPAGRFAVFPSVEAGFAAMHALFEAPGYRALTVQQALNRWAPPVENDTSAYTANVCAWVGCKPTDPIAPLLAVPPVGWAPAAPVLPFAPRIPVAIGASLQNAGKR